MSPSSATPSASRASSSPRKRPRSPATFVRSALGSFHRALALPTKVEADKAEAVFENGVLTLTMPKAEAVKPKTIKVKARAVIEGEKGRMAVRPC